MKKSEREDRQNKICVMSYVAKIIAFWGYTVPLHSLRGLLIVNIYCIYQVQVQGVV